MKAQPFDRIAVVNRGEAAMRLLHAARELANETGRDLRVIALYTEPDARSLFVREADEAVALGPALVADASGRRRSAYLDHERVLAAVEAARADAVWVGWGFVAEDAAFAAKCEERGLVFVGPPAAVMRRLGDKIEAKRLAESLGLPVAAWSREPVPDAAAPAVAARIGYPLLVKAAQAGGGRGIRRVDRPEELAAAMESARAEALKAFGEGAVYLEKLVGAARHVEVQVMADVHGTCWALGVRDCTIQRRNQKVVEEAPSPVLPAALAERVRELSARLVREAGYVNAGTVEWLYEPATGQLYLMEVNTRLQVEHPVTELTTGVDLVKLQLAVASGERLAPEPPPTRGHAVEVRLCAEDPDNGFAPSPGDVEVFRIATGAGLRVDTGVGPHDRIAPEFDSMIAKLVAYGSTRPEAIARLRRALSQTSILLRGGATNKAFLHDVLGDPDYVGCRTDTGWLDRRTAAQGPTPRPHADVALLYAAIEAFDAQLALERAAFADGGRGARGAGEGPVTVELRYRHERYELRVACSGADTYRVTVDGRTVGVAVDRDAGPDVWLRCGGRRHRIVSVVHGPHEIVEVDGIPHRIARDQGDVVRAPSPAVILSVSVQPGDVVQAGDVLVALEAMKMEMPVRAPVRGRVRAVHVTPNVQVGSGAPLVELEPLERGTGAGAGERVAFGAPAAPTPPATPIETCRSALATLLAFMSGYDVDASEVAEGMRAAAPHLGLVDEDAAAWRLEHDVLVRFVELATTFRRPAPVGQTPAPSPVEQLLGAWRAQPTRAPALPAEASIALKRALEPYGVRSLERTPRSEEALYRAAGAFRRLRADLGPVITLLGRPRHGVDPIASPRPAARLRTLLERVIGASQAFEAMNDLARRVRHRYLDAPLFDERRAAVYRRLEARLEELATDPRRARADGALRELVECPYSLLSFLAPAFAARRPELEPVLLEVFVRRYYSDRGIEAVRMEHRGGRPWAVAELVDEGRPVHIVVTSVPWDEVAATLATARAVVSAIPASAEVVLDVIATDGRAAGPVELARELETKLAGVDLGRPVRHACVSVLRPAERELAGYFTFEAPAAVLVPSAAPHDIHPMMAERLELTRLDNFVTTRLPAASDVFFFHAVARDNPRDERLFAFINVRDLTALRDEAGHVVALPHLEQQFLEGVAAMRDYRARHPGKSLHWNRILLYLHPPAQLRLREVRRVIWRVAQATRDVGLEKVVARVRLPDSRSDGITERVLHLSLHEGKIVRLRVSTPAAEPIRTRTPYKMRVAEARRRGTTYPYEIVRMLTPRELEPPLLVPPGRFVEHDLDPSGRLVPVERPYGENQANVVVGLLTSFMRRYEDVGVQSVLVLSDPTREMGALAEPECRRIIAALELAHERGLPVDWFPVSAGAKIAMDSGTENLDWTARVLRRLVELTDRGLEVNVVVDGINVGAQSYWNAEATMLMHTRGILVMTGEGSMVLTGKQALDYSGSVSAEDHQGIGGVERIMGPNGQAQYAARDLTAACGILLRHHELTYVAPGERFPRPSVSRDPATRDVTATPYSDPQGAFSTVGDVFAAETNPGKKKPFDIRQVMRAVADQDEEPLERWALMRHAETAVVWDAFVGGHAVCLCGIESQRVTRQGHVPPDGPGEWTGGTLFPLSSKKVARAINAASGRRPLVVLANLSGFDGSPESMRKLQLEYGAEIGRAVVRFDGPIVFCVISRYHGGAYVVFSRTLHDNLEVAALEGTYASVIGGAPAAAVVFARDVRTLTHGDPRVAALRSRIEQAAGQDKARLLAELAELMRGVFNEKLGEVAERFDRIHTVERAREVGSLEHIIAPRDLRPYLVAAVERGIVRATAHAGRRSGS